MSKPIIPKEIGGGAIIFLIGTSTAGKTTLCQEVITQDLALPTEERIKFQTWGDDAERKWLDEEDTNNLKENDTPRNWNERTFDRAIAASRAGETMILDTFLDHDEVGGKVIWDHCREYLDSKKFTCPMRVVFLHLPVLELAKRITERNFRALAEGGDSSDAREGIGPFQAVAKYAELFCAHDEEAGSGIALGEDLRRDVVEEVVREFACDEDGRRFLEMEDKAAAKLLIDEQSKDLLQKLGFKDREELISLGTKGWRPDAIYDNSKTPTSEIAMEIRGWAFCAIQEIQQELERSITQISHAAEEEKESFIEKLGEKPRSFVETMQAGKYGKLKSLGGSHEL